MTRLVRRDVGPQSLPVVAANPISGGGGGGGVSEVLLWSDPWEDFAASSGTGWHNGVGGLWNYSPGGTGYFYLASGVGTGPDLYGVFQSNNLIHEFSGVPQLPSAPLAAKFSINFSLYNFSGSNNPDGYMCFETPFCTAQVVIGYNAVDSYTVSLYNSRNFVNGVDGGGTPVGTINIGTGFSRLEVESDVNGGWVARLVPPTGSTVSFSGAMPSPTAWSSVTVRMGATVLFDGLYVNNARFVEIVGGSSAGGGGGFDGRVDYPLQVIVFHSQLFSGSATMTKMVVDSDLMVVPHGWYISGLGGIVDPPPTTGQSVTARVDLSGQPEIPFTSSDIGGATASWGKLYSTDPIYPPAGFSFNDINVVLTSDYTCLAVVYMYMRLLRIWP
jgi:hypothetical protein